MEPSPKNFLTEKVLEMAEKPTYEELEQRIQELEKTEFELKRVEKELQESENRYRNIVSVHGVIFAICEES